MVFQDIQMADWEKLNLGRRTHKTYGEHVTRIFHEKINNKMKLDK